MITFSGTKPPLLVIAGPTASGKTALAVELALRLNGEVVSADSMQVYADLFIGTARPTEEEMRGVPHHLLGFLPLSQAYSVAQYAQDARRVIADIHRRGKLPILCGGTGLYIRAVTDNIQFWEEDGPGEEVREQLRKQLRARAREEGGEKLLAELAEVDPPTAARLHPNDTGRIVRALEVYHLTGVPLSEQMKRSRQQPSTYEVVFVFLDCRNRQVLYSRINRRADAMLRAGLLEEARAVLSTPYAPTAMQAIGYKELAPYFRGELTLEQAMDKLKQSTRRYAKRQLSWFRQIPNTIHVFIDDYPDAAAMAEALVG